MTYKKLFEIYAARKAEDYVEKLAREAGYDVLGADAKVTTTSTEKDYVSAELSVTVDVYKYGICYMPVPLVVHVSAFETCLGVDTSIIVYDERHRVIWSDSKALRDVYELESFKLPD